MRGAIRHLGFLILIVVSLVSIRAQTPRDDATQRPKAIKFGEVGTVNDCEFRTAVRRYHVELINTPHSQGYIINYSSTSSTAYEDETARRERLITRVIAGVRFDRSRITLLRAGYRLKSATELWIIPPGADNPTPSGEIPASSSLSEFKRPYDVREFEEVVDEFALDSIRKQEDAERTAIKKEAGFPEQEASDNEVESPDEETAKEWHETWRFRWANVGIATRLANTKGTTGLILFYADNQRYDIAKVTRFVEQARDLLAKDARINASRLEVKFGGYRETAEAEFWVMRSTDAYPVLRPDERCDDEAQGPKE